MAEEQDLTLDQDNAEEQGGGKKKLIIIIVAIVLLIGIAIGVTVFLMAIAMRVKMERLPKVRLRKWLKIYQLLQFI